MKKIGIITNRDKDAGLAVTGELVKLIKRKGGEPVLVSDVSEEIGANCDAPDENTVIERSEVIVCLGGDGTFLKVARSIYTKKVPMLGINLGSLGFLTEVDKNDMEIAVESLLNDKFAMEERMMLEAAVTRDGSLIAGDIALNDVVISRGALSRILRIKTYINGTFVDTFPGDGLIVSSPTGSTGYSLSAGGPIVEPDTDLIIVSPICPHILYSRSFVTTGDRSVRAVVDEGYSHTAMVTVDGQEGYEIRGGDVIEVKKASHTVKIVRINTRNFYNVLRTKIYFRGESIRKHEI